MIEILFCFLPVSQLMWKWFDLKNLHQIGKKARQKKPGTVKIERIS